MVEAADDAHFAISAPGPSRSTADFAALTGAVVAISGGLFDVHELPMGPTRAGGRDRPISARQASSAGIALQPLAKWLVSLGVERALNLDGGGSTSLVLKGRLVTGVGMRIPVSLGVLAGPVRP